MANPKTFGSYAIRTIDGHHIGIIWAYGVETLPNKNPFEKVSRTGFLDNNGGYAAIIHSDRASWELS